MKNVRKHNGFSIVAAPPVSLFGLVLLVWFWAYVSLSSHHAQSEIKASGHRTALRTAEKGSAYAELTPEMAKEFVQWWIGFAFDYSETRKKSREVAKEWMQEERVAPFQKVFFAERPGDHIVFNPTRIFVRGSLPRSAHITLEGVFASVDDRENVLDYADAEISVYVCKADNGLRISGFDLTPEAKYSLQRFFSKADGKDCHLFALGSPSQLKALQHLSAAVNCLNANEFKRCLYYVDRTLEFNPTCAQAHAIRGYALGQLGQAVAESECDLAVTMNPEDVGSRFYRAMTRTDLGNTKAALEDYDFVVEHTSVWWRQCAFHNRGNLRSGLGDHTGAIKDFSAAISMEPSTSAYSYWARAYERELLGQNELAMQDYDKAIEIYPMEFSFYQRRGNLRCRLGDYEGGKRDFTSVIVLNPTSKAYVDRGYARERGGDTARAIADYTNATLTSPVNFKAYSYRGWLKRNTDLKGALADLNRGIQLAPTHPWHYLAREYVREQLGDTKGALADLDEYIKLEPSNATAYKDRGQLYLRAGNLGIALKEFRQSIAINPMLVSGYVGCAEVSLKRKQYESALGYCDKGIAQFLQTSKDRDTYEAYKLYGIRAWLHARAGDSTFALADLEQMKAVEPTLFHEMRKGNSQDKLLKPLISKIE